MSGGPAGDPDLKRQHRHTGTERVLYHVASQGDLVVYLACHSQSTTLTEDLLGVLEPFDLKGQLETCGVGRRTDLHDAKPMCGRNRLLRRWRFGMALEG